MAIGLGRSIGSPVFLFFQIVHGVSLFLVMLGVSRVFLGMLELASSASSLPPTTTTTTISPVEGVIPRPDYLRPPLAAPPLSLAHGTARVVAFAADDAPTALSFAALLSSCFHVPLLSLFHSPVAVYASGETHDTHNAVDDDAAAAVAAYRLASPASTARTLMRHDGSTARFYGQHLLAALLCAYPLALLLQRRKFVLDFVATIYAVYWVMTNLMLQAVLGGGTLHWWGACVLGFAAMYGTTHVICSRKELQEVRLSGGAGSTATTTTATATVSAAAAAPTGTSATIYSALGMGSLWLKDSRGEGAREMEELTAPFQDGHTLPGASVMSSGAAGAAIATGRGRGDGLGAPSSKSTMAEAHGSDEGGLFKSKSV